MRVTSWWMSSRSSGVTKVLERLDRLVGDLVAALLDRLDRERAPLDFVEALHQRRKLAARLHRLAGERVEEIEEPALEGQQPAEH